KCGKKLGSKHALDYHMRMHNGVKPFKCPYCGRSYRDNFLRNTHIRKDHQFLISPYYPVTCDLCGQKARHYFLSPSHSDAVNFFNNLIQ
ncbi:hypothetical protein PMAYCL1PPCAC_08295, partial [Pristionchus mayeri]